MTSFPYSSAAERNQEPIFGRLKGLLPEQGTVIEIGTGNGQHAIYFCRQLHKLQWQPTDRSENLAGLKLQFEAEDCSRILPALQLDVLKDNWPLTSYAAAFSANTAHIMSWIAVEAMFAGVAGLLQPSARFFLYGPFNVDGRFTSEGNARFDQQLREGNSEMGIRDLENIEQLADQNGMILQHQHNMPANNFLLVFASI